MAKGKVFNASDARKLLALIDGKKNKGFKQTAGTAVLPDVLVVMCAEGCTAATFDTVNVAGEGTGVVQMFKLYEGTPDEWHIEDFVTSSENTIEVTFYNTTPNELPAGLMQLKRESITNKYLVDVASCS